MNPRQQYQINQIQKDLDKIIEEHPELSIFVNIVKQDYEIEYTHLKKYLNTHKDIGIFIHYYQDRIKYLNELRDG